MNDNMRDILLIWTPQGLDWLVILVVALLLFGKRLPDVARSIGKSLTEFKKGLSEAHEIKDDVTNDVNKLRDDVVNQTKDALNDSDKNT